MVDLSDRERISMICSAVLTIYACDRRTDRRTELAWHIRAIAYMLSRVISVRFSFCRKETSDHGIMLTHCAAAIISAHPSACRLSVTLVFLLQMLFVHKPSLAACLDSQYYSEIPHPSLPNLYSHSTVHISSAWELSPRLCRRAARNSNMREPARTSDVDTDGGRAATCTET